MSRAIVMFMPVHAGGDVVVLLQPIDTDVPGLGFRISSDDGSQRHKGTGILRPALDDWQFVQHGLRGLGYHHFLTGRRSLNHPWRKLPYLQQSREKGEFIDDRLRNLRLEQFSDAKGDVIEAFNFQRLAYPAHGTE